MPKQFQGVLLKGVSAPPGVRLLDGWSVMLIDGWPYVVATVITPTAIQGKVNVEIQVAPLVEAPGEEQ